MRQRQDTSRGAGPRATGRDLGALGPDRRGRPRRRRGLVPGLMALEGRLLLSAGDLDPTFRPTGMPPGIAKLDISGSTDTAEAVAVQPDGKIVVGGSANVDSHLRFAVARLMPDGTLDHAFGEMASGIRTTVIGSAARIHAIALQPDGKIVAVGEMLNGLGNYDFAVARYRADGSLDPAFGAGGVVTTAVGLSDDMAFAVGVQADGKIVVAGDSWVAGDYDVALVRYNANGSLDHGFDGDGIVRRDFGNFHDDHARALAIQPDGKIVVAGSMWGDSDDDLLVARFLAGGNLDTGVLGGFGDAVVVGGIIQRRGYAYTDVSPSDRANAVLVQPDGKVVAAGKFRWLGSDAIVVARYRADGLLDTSFNMDGKYQYSYSAADDFAVGLTRQPDGKVIVAAQVGATGGTDVGLFRLTVDGRRDDSFMPTSPNGAFRLHILAVDQPGAVAVTPAGRVLVVGSTRSAGGDLDWFVAGVVRGGLAIGDHDGDGSTDPTVFEPSTSTFYVARSTLGNSPKQLGRGTNTGGNPVPVPADYDGDGLIDPAVYEPSNSVFTFPDPVHGSRTVQFGIGMDFGGHPTPVVADYDGDGRADPAVYEPSTSTFYLARSALGNVARQFGIGSNSGGHPVPIPGDYDGDGKADPAVFEPSSSTFYLARSRLGSTAKQFGIGTAFGGHPTPIPGDYDGDGLTDPAVFEPSTSTFYLARSRLGNIAKQFGIGTDFGGHPVAIPGDYDGDARVDPAVYEPSNSTFYLARSALGNTTEQFGIGTLNGGHPAPIPGDYDGDGLADPTVYEPSTSTFYVARSKLGNTSKQFGIGTAFGGHPVPLPRWRFA